MTYDELIRFQKVSIPLEVGLSSLNPEEQKARLSVLLTKQRGNLGSEDIKDLDMGLFMMQYGIKGIDTYGPSPILRSTPLGAFLAEGVNAEMQGLGKWLVIQRHARHFWWVDHSHSFVEMNYMLTGACVNIVNGKKLSMKKGDLLIMAPGCRHEIEPLGEDDLLINMILLPVSAETILEKTIPGNSEIAQFLIAALYSASSKSNYAFFGSHGEEDIERAAVNIMREYYDQAQVASEVLVECRMHELFALLWRFNAQQPDKVIYAFKPNSNAAMIVNYIKEHCRTCTRESVAKYFSYSPSHLSNLLIESIGKGLIQLRNEFRLHAAEDILTSTELPVRTIAEDCGFTNITQFYKLYKEYYGRLPREILQ